MGRLIKAIEAFKKLDAVQAAQDAINEAKEDLAQEQRDQLTEGQTSTGDTLSKYRNKSYALKKNAINPLPGLGNPDLKLFGNFYKGITAVAENGKVIIKSSDEKAPHLEERYGKDLIFGLNSKHKAEFIRERLKPVYIRNIKKQISS